MNVWDELLNGKDGVKGIIEISADRFLEDLWEINLIANIIVSGGKNRDLEYFSSDEYYYHCMLIRLDPDEIYQHVKTIWKVLDDNIQK